ncbi:putative short chain dehydrogenase/reductase [Mesorhizobium tianshanense]|uniref:Short-subunit dehydrogenase n=1 Tax=Mesorhizobium tianshanense TaxID=39844 RepID=A0A562P346_9HYPH|nr:SDR family oxidoreductase [Mesorhizobium tianshanense]TWI38761.1 short-subunit dehydrogenase [Mesorhizobium tianshanense]GLS36695.1 putative short chain dehydrogenase/reductase [Mesorhizobium tianshanense]
MIGELSRVVLVTGGARGIGAAFARLAVARGHRVMVADIDESGAGSLASELGANARHVCLDIRSPESWQAALDTTYEVFGRLDVLVNNAAVVYPGLTKDVPLAKHKETFEVNVLGPMLGILAVTPRFQAQASGHVITVCSMSAFLALPGIASYSASKSALRTLHLALALEERGSSIDFTIVHPGATETRMLEDEARKGVAVAFARPPARPEDVAKILMKAMKTKKVEICIPESRGRSVKAIAGNPRRLLEMVEKNEQLGAKMLQERLNAHATEHDRIEADRGQG